MKTMVMNFKERVTSKRGSVLFIVLVLMSFLVMIASAVFYTVSTGRQNVVAEYSDSQAFQTANDLLGVINNYLTEADPSGNARDLTNAMAGLNIEDAVRMWTAVLDQNPHTTVADLIAGVTVGGTTHTFGAGVHYLETIGASNIPGGGSASIFIYINYRGDLVVEVTVEYNGRKVTANRIYDRDSVDFVFRPIWRNYATNSGRGLGWVWEAFSDAQGAGPWEDVVSSHRLAARGPVNGSGTNPPWSTGIYVRERNGDVSDYRRLGMQFRTGNTDSPVTTNLDLARQVCVPYYMGDGLWLMTGSGSSAPAPITGGFTQAHPGLQRCGCPDNKCLTAYNDLSGGMHPNAPGFVWRRVDSVPTLNHPALKADDLVGWVPAPDIYPACNRCQAVSGPINNCRCCYVDTPCGNADGRLGRTAGDDWHPHPRFISRTGSVINNRCEWCWSQSNTPDTATCLRCSRLVSVCGPANAPTCCQYCGGGAWRATPPCAFRVSPAAAPTCAQSRSSCGTPGCSGSWSVLATNTIIRCCTYSEHTNNQNVGGSPGCSTWTTNNPCWRPACPGEESGGGGVRIPGEQWVDNQGRPVAPNTPNAINLQGAMSFSAPGVDLTWYQRAAHHSTGAGKSGMTFDRLGLRGVNATSHYDVDWAILDKDSTRGSWRSDISANNHLVLGDSQIENPAAFARTMEITVRGSMFIGDLRGSGSYTPAPPSLSFQNANGRITGSNITIRVQGNLYANAGNNTCYGNSNTTIYYVLGNFVQNGTAWPTGSNAPIVYVAGNIPNNAGANVRPWTGAGNTQTQQQVRDVIDFYTGGVPTGMDWPMATTAPRGVIVSWGAGNRGDWTSSFTNTNNPLTNRYGIAINDTIRNRIFYIDRDATITINSPTGRDQNSINMIIVDTGLGADARTVSLRLPANDGTRFNWKQGMGQTYRTAVMSIGDGTVVLEVPTGVRYAPGEGIYVGPFNLAVRRDTGGTDWINCSRLQTLSRGEIRGSDSIACLQNCGDSGIGDRYNGAPFSRNRCQWSCWLTGLLERNGSGRVRTDFHAEEIRTRSHANPLNMNIYIAYNGTADDGVRLPRGTFFAGGVYAPRMAFSTPDSGDNMVIHFGSIFTSELRLQCQYFFIAVLPGGGVGNPPMPTGTTPTPIERTTHDPGSTPPPAPGGSPDRIPPPTPSVPVQDIESGTDGSGSDVRGDINAGDPFSVI